MLAIRALSSDRAHGCDRKWSSGKCHWGAAAGI